MKIVGVGCGPDMLTKQAAEAISSGTQIFGSERAIKLAQPYITKESTVNVIMNYKSLKELPDDAIVLSTGDPMLAGLGYLNGEVIPGISSLSYAASKLQIRLINVSVVAAHGRDHEKAVKETISELQRGKTVFIIADPEFSVKNLCDRLYKFNNFSVAVCEKLGYPDERIVTGTVKEPPVPHTGMFVLFIYA